MRGLALAVLLATPAAAAGGDVAAEWRGLQDRCEQAVLRGAALDVAGLERRAPTFVGRVVEEPPFGVRIERVPLRTSGRLVPTGIWGRPGGRLELVLLEFPTQAGVRALCEVRLRRGAAPLAEGETAAVAAAAERLAEAHVASGEAEVGPTGGATVALVFLEPNPRGCPVGTSLFADGGGLRSSAAERAGAPDCGGASFAGGITRPPRSLNGGDRR